MPLYKYDSFSRRGKRVNGFLEAVSLQSAKELLRGQGLMPVNIVEVAGEGQGFTLRSLFEKRIEPKTIIVFTKQFSVLLQSGVPLIQCFELLIEQFDGKFRRLLVRIKDNVKSGSSLGKELAKYPKVFSNVYVQLVRAGEASGKLDVILNRLTEYLERSEEVKKRVKKATSYPVMMISFAFIVVIGMLAFVVPRLTGMFTQAGKKLPLPTQILVTMSNALVGHFALIAGSIVCAVVGFVYWKSTEKGRYKFDELLLWFPLTSYFSRTRAVVQFCKTLGMLIESGVNLAESLDIVCNIVENKVLVQKLKEARDKIIKEGKIARYLKQTGIFPNIASYMISSGEESGELGKMLLSVGNDYGDELMDITDGLTAKIGPLMTVVLGAIVAFIIVSIFLPIMNMGDIAGI